MNRQRLLESLSLRFPSLRFVLAVLLALPTATWFVNASFVPSHVLRLSVSPPTCACPAALAAYTAMPCACPDSPAATQSLYLALAVVVAGCSTQASAPFRLPPPQVRTARPEAPSPHHPPRAAVRRAGVVAPVPTQPTPRLLAPVLTLSPPLLPHCYLNRKPP